MLIDDVSVIEHGHRRRPNVAPALKAWLTARRLPVILAILAMLLTLPSLTVGWVADDYYHRLRLVGPTLLPGLNLSANDLFTFAGGDLEENARLIDLGCWPWWTVPSLRASFWRPVTVLTHRLDYLLWPNWPVLMHVQSILWYAALVAAAAVLYRRMMGITWVAGLAALFYAIDDARGMPVGFLANRNGVIAALFGVLAIIAHDQWRRRGWRGGIIVGPMLLLAALLSAEAGLGAIAYILAHALFLERKKGLHRIAVLLPYVIVIVGWRIAWSLSGHGVWGIGGYVDPLTEPVRYLGAVLRQAPVFLLGQWAIPASDLYVVAIELGFAGLLTLFAVAVVGVIAVIMIPLLRGDALMRFWVVGMALSLGPICATFPADRMLFFVGLGAFALLARFLSAVIERAGWLAKTETHALRRLVTVSLALFFVSIHGVLAPIGLALRSGMPIGPKSLLESIHVNVPMDTSVEEQSVVIVNTPIVLAGGYLPIRNALAGRPVPAHTRTLAPHQPPVVVTRRDTQTLVIRPNRGFLKSPWDQLGRGVNHSMTLGERVELTGMTAEVTALTDDRRPAEVAFHFDVPLEDSSLLWLCWTGRTYEPFVPPVVGATVTLPRQE